jgi:hypothetical protein
LFFLLLHFCPSSPHRKPLHFFPFHFASKFSSWCPRSFTLPNLFSTLLIHHRRRGAQIFSLTSPPPSISQLSSLESDHHFRDRANFKMGPGADGITWTVLGAPFCASVASHSVDFRALATPTENRSARLFLVKLKMDLHKTGSHDRRNRAILHTATRESLSPLAGRCEIL